MIDDSSTDVNSGSSNQQIDDAPGQMRPDFTFMGNDPNNNAVFDQISKFTSVEQYREFLEKELGEEIVMKAYPILKEFVSYSNIIKDSNRETTFCSLRRQPSWKNYFRR